MKRMILSLALSAFLGSSSIATFTVAQEAGVPGSGTQTKQETSIEVTITTKPGGEEDDEKTVDPADEDRPLIQVALLLDTSNSMDGLIEQAKTQLWSIVNNLAETKKDGKVPKIQVALFEYGNDGLPVTEDYLRQVVPLTTDLDKLSEALFALKTNGGSEYCGAVIGKAANVLNWQKGDGAYKTIFIAGNEPFTQGETDYTVSCADARAKGIVINTIHCGPENVGVSGKWKHGAEVGGGRYMVIDSDKKVADIPCPQDDILIKLNIKLNGTYIPYGAQGKAGATRQLAQDQAQGGLSKNSLGGRIASKGNSALYYNGHWDLVDASEKENFKLSTIDKKTLPEKLRGLSDADLKKYIEQQRAQRANIQKQIATVAKQRAEFLTDYRRKQAEAAGSAEAPADSLGGALNDAAMEQAEARGFKKK